MTEYKCKLCGRVVHVSDGQNPVCPDHGSGRHMKETGKKPLPKEFRMTDRR